MTVAKSIDKWIGMVVLSGALSIGLVAVLASDSPKSAAEPKLPEGPLGDVIRLGEELVENTTTHAMTKPYVGNALNCTSCHLANGTDRRAATFIGVATAYPAWSPREGRVITLEDRVLNCFMRSCGGIRPPLGSKPSVAITAYITWLSQGESLRMNGKGPHGPLAIPALSIDANTADAVRGKRLYARKCADCHGKDGSGDEDNPPVWGPRSYNQGAGLARVPQLANWLKVAMPLDDTTLTDREALDIAAYVDSHERPAFKLQSRLPDKSRLGEYNAEPGR